MKTLKNLIAMCFVLGIATIALHAQPAKALITWDDYWGPVTVTPIDNECLTEDLVGTFHYLGYIFNSYVQEKWTGEFIGQTTNLVYTFDGIMTHHWTTNLHEGNWGTASNEKLRCEGKLIGMIHFNSLTNWVNDELHIDISNIRISCK